MIKKPDGALHQYFMLVQFWRMRSKNFNKECIIRIADGKIRIDPRDTGHKPHTYKVLHTKMCDKRQKMQDGWQSRLLTQVFPALSLVADPWWYSRNSSSVNTLQYKQLSTKGSYCINVKARDTRKNKRQRSKTFFLAAPSTCTDRPRIKNRLLLHAGRARTFFPPPEKSSANVYRRPAGDSFPSKPVSSADDSALSSAIKFTMPVAEYLAFYSQNILYSCDVKLNWDYDTTISWIIK